MSQSEIKNTTMSLKRKKLITVLVLLAAAAGIGAWLLIKPDSTYDGLVSGNGRIEATEIDIAAKLGGRVAEIMAAEGDFVKKGQIVAKMQTDVLEAQRNEALARLRQASAAVGEAEAQVSVRKSNAVTAEAVVQQRRSELEGVERRFQRTKELMDEDVIAAQEFDDVKADYYGKKAEVASAVSQVVSARAAIKAAQAQVLNARHNEAAAHSTVVRIEADIEDSLLKAPRDGRIQYRVSEPGEVLGAGGKVLSMVDLSDVYMTFFLPEKAAGRVAIGSEVRIVLDAAPEYVIPARVTFVASVAQFTPKTVETASERQKLMFRIKAGISPVLLRRNINMVKTGLPGVAWLKLDKEAKWPPELEISAAE